MAPDSAEPPSDWHQSKAPPAQHAAVGIAVASAGQGHSVAGRGVLILCPAHHTPPLESWAQTEPLPNRRFASNTKSIVCLIGAGAWSDRTAW